MYQKEFDLDTEKELKNSSVRENFGCDGWAGCPFKDRVRFEARAAPNAGESRRTYGHKSPRNQPRQKNPTFPLEFQESRGIRADSSVAIDAGRCQAKENHKKN